MLISRTPYRISFFGGGTDYSSWYKRYGGEVISTTIDKYVYLTCRQLPKFFDHKYRIVYSKIELANKSNEIEHLVVRKLLQHTKFKNGIELHYDGDLPAQSGMGSSSSFIVGCTNILSSMQNQNFSKKKLANKSLYFEQKILKEIVGSQDQIATSYGGFNSIKFFKDGSYTIKELKIDKTIKKKLNKRLILLYTGNQRRANDIAKTYVSKLTKQKKKQMMEIQGFVDKAKIFLKKGLLDDFGSLLDESWQKKKELSVNISSSFIDNIYSKAIQNGALGGKILGAGGGGFFLFYVREDKFQNFKKSLNNFELVPFNFEKEGSSIIFDSKKKNV